MIESGRIASFIWCIMHIKCFGHVHRLSPYSQVSFISIFVYFDDKLKNCCVSVWLFISTHYLHVLRAMANHYALSELRQIHVYGTVTRQRMYSQHLEIFERKQDFTEWWWSIHVFVCCRPTFWKRKKVLIRTSKCIWIELEWWSSVTNAFNLVCNNCV